ncbi:hypothetical protein NORO109296_25855 [Nocardiopsis rhodophaea]
MPPLWAGCSRTWMPWRAARRLTTNRPMRRETATSMTGGWERRSLISVSSSASIPMPLSVTSIRTPPLSRASASTETSESLGENEVAFSTSSATRWMTSLTGRPSTEMWEGARTLTRSYCSTSEAAARSTSTSGTGCAHLRVLSWPERTSRFSLLRRIRVARWSSENRSDSRSESCSLCSRPSMSRSCRSTSVWLRRDRLTNIALTLLRRAASSEARRSATRWTSSKERATSPISSSVPTSMGATVTSSGAELVSCIRVMESGRSSSAIRMAPSRSRRRGWTSERTTSEVTAKTAMITSRTISVSTTARHRASDSRLEAREPTEPASFCSTFSILFRVEPAASS